jgi:L-lysine 2,3-aminomutase
MLVMKTCTCTPDLATPADATWQAVLAAAIRSPTELCRRLGLPSALAAEAERASIGFPLLVPEPYLARIRPGDPTDPLLLQVLPRLAETVATPGYCADPLGEAGALCAPNLLQKYHGRILIVTTRACGVHCRFCFRRHFPHVSMSSTWQPAVQQIAADPSIEEVILSGGDPLAMPDCDLTQLVGQLAQIPHLRRLRIHTRLPVVIPERVTDDLIRGLRGSRLPILVVVQVNHPAEIDDAVAKAFGQLVDAGIPVLNQSVLLRGVNDRADVLAQLCRRLVDLRVMPYYLHQLDPVAGAAHFEVPISTGIALITELRTQLPGYAVPRYVREMPGGTNKEVLA